MKLNEQYKLKRLALGMSYKEFAAIAQVDEGTVMLFERGEKINNIDFVKIKENIESYIRSFDREKYLATRIIEETLTYLNETSEEHPKTLGHLLIHVSKLNMMYVGEKRDFD